MGLKITVRPSVRPSPVCRRPYITFWGRSRSVRRLHADERGESEREEHNLKELCSLPPRLVGMMGTAEKNLRGRTVSSATRLIFAETPQLNHPLLPSHHYPRVGLRPNQDLQIGKHSGQLNFTINSL